MALGFVAPTLCAQPTAGPVILDHPYVPGEVVVRFDGSTTPTQAEQILLGAGALSFNQRFTPGLYLAVIPPTEDALLQFMATVVLSPQVLDVLPNYLGQGGFVPDDPAYPSQWHLEQASDVDIDAEAAWDVTRGSSETVIAVVDAGLHFSHPDFGSRLYTSQADPDNGLDDDANGLVDDTNGWDFVSNNSSPDVEEPLDPGHPHGTWVTSALAASSNNTFQVAGVDHFARIMPIRVLAPDNSGALADLVDALNYLATRDDVDLVNLSLIRYPVVAVLSEALDAAAEKSILISCAGNDGAETADGQYPGAHPVTISVGVTTDTDTLWPMSSTGQSLGFVAPGANLVLADADSPFGSEEYFVGSGCSFATPLVTGIAGLLKARYPWMTQDQLRQILRESAQDLGPPGWDPEFGWGRVNAKNALDRATTLLEIFADGFETGDTSRWSLAFP